MRWVIVCEIWSVTVSRGAGRDLDIKILVSCATFLSWFFFFFFLLTFILPRGLELFPSYRGEIFEVIGNWTKGHSLNFCSNVFSHQLCGIRKLHGNTFNFPHESSWWGLWARRSGRQSVKQSTCCISLGTRVWSPVPTEEVRCMRPQRRSKSERRGGGTGPTHQPSTSRQVRSIGISLLP